MPPPICSVEDILTLCTYRLENAIRLVEEGSTYASIADQIGITRDEAKIVACARKGGQIEQLRREMLLAEILEIAASRLRSGEGWEESTVGDVLREIRNGYPEQTEAVLSLMVENPELSLSVLLTDAPHFCPECKNGYGCEEEPCTAAYESICDSCNQRINGGAVQSGD